MRQVLVLTAALLIGGSYLARYADKAVVEAPTLHAAGRDGHFHAEARVDGRHIDFMVDTGATLVALRETDAAMAGIRPAPRDYTAAVSTANGTIKAARAKLERIEIGDITVFDVPALVLPDEALAQSLLGMAFLSRLRRFEVADGRLMLEQ